MRLLLIAVPALLCASDIESLAWMTGCWTTTRNSVTIEEHWSRPSAGNMLGYSRTLKSGRMIFHEFMRIEQTETAIIYHARIGPSSPGTRFTLRTTTADSVVFENPEHDFPQRILYRRTPTGIAARIEGISKGKDRFQDFPFERSPCH